MKLFMFYSNFIQIGAGEARTNITKEKKCMEFSRNIELSEQSIGHLKQH